MRKTSKGDGQITFALKPAGTSTRVSEVVRRIGVFRVGHYWKKVHRGLGAGELQRLGLLEDENRTLKQLLADLIDLLRMARGSYRARSRKASVRRLNA